MYYFSLIYFGLKTSGSPLCGRVVNVFGEAGHDEGFCVIVCWCEVSEFAVWQCKMDAGDWMRRRMESLYNVGRLSYVVLWVSCFCNTLFQNFVRISPEI